MPITPDILSAFPSDRTVIVLFRDVEQFRGSPLEGLEATIRDQVERRRGSARVDREEGLCLAYQVRDDDAASGREAIRRYGVKAFQVLEEVKATRVAVVDLTGERTTALFDLTEGLLLTAYRFTKYFSEASEREISLQEIGLYREEGILAEELRELEAAVKGTYLARDLVNEPLSFLTAVQLGDSLREAGEDSGFRVEVLNKPKIEALKMGGLLSVNKGSVDPPTFSILEWKPENAVNEKPYVLVGKGIVYDTGGMSLKSTPGSMDKMKADMGGAAAVAGAFKALAEAEVPVHVIGLIPATDNRPAGNAYVPGDVIRMHDGSTVEVMNTDAEGRLVMADALTYAKRYDPELIIDLATLTGSAAGILGPHGIVSMGTAGGEWFEALEASGQNVYERAVRLPLWEEYAELIRSDIADVKNVGGKYAGAIVAGKFLQRFVEAPWIHLDIAGSAILDQQDQYRSKGGSGVGVRLLYDLFKNKAQL